MEEHKSTESKLENLEEKLDKVLANQKKIQKTLDEVADYAVAESRRDLDE